MKHLSCINKTQLWTIKEFWKIGLENTFNTYFQPDDGDDDDDDVGVVFIIVVAGVVIQNVRTIRPTGIII